MQSLNREDEDDLDRKPAAKYLPDTGSDCKKGENQRNEEIAEISSFLFQVTDASSNVAATASTNRTRFINRVSNSKYNDKSIELSGRLPRLAPKNVPLREYYTSGGSVIGKTLAGAQGPGTDQPVMSDDNALIPTKVLNDFSDNAKVWHTNVLLHLLSSADYGRNRLEELAKKCGFTENLLSDVTSFIELSRSSEAAVALDTFLPSKLAYLAKIERDHNCNMKDPIPGRSTVTLKDQYPEYSSLKLQDLEQSTRHWYLTTIKAREIGLGQSPHRTSATLEGSTARFFSLKFNEGSLSTISKWSCRNGSNDVFDQSDDRKKGVAASSHEADTIEWKPEDKIRRSPSRLRSLKQPTVDKRFRKCSVCKFWGHYEIECPSLRFHEILRFGQALRKKTLKRSHPNGSGDVVTQDATTLVEALARPNHDQVSSSLDEGRANAEILTADGNHDSGVNECAVTTEMFLGFLFEQRSAPEELTGLEKTRPAVVFPGTEYDDSFAVDGFCIKAASSLKRLEEGEALTSSSRQKGSECKDNSVEIESNKFKRDVAFQRSKFREGDVVAWFVQDGSCQEQGENTAVSSGIVVSVSDQGNQMEKIGVEFLAFIPSTLEDNADDKSPCTTASPASVPTRAAPTKQCISLPAGPGHVLPFGSLIWIPANSLFLVTDQIDVAHPQELRRRKRKYCHRKNDGNSAVESLTAKTNSKNVLAAPDDVSPSIPKEYKKRSQSYKERFKETGRVHSKDMSLAPRKPARKLPDGTYSMPQGRRPVGLEWDSIRGLWTLPHKKLRKKTTKKRKLMLPKKQS